MFCHTNTTFEYISIFTSFYFTVQVANIPLPCENYQVVYAAQNGNTFSIKLYANGLVSGTFEHYTQDVHKQLISIDVSTVPLFH